MEIKKENPLGYFPVGRLLKRFAIPSIIAMLVGALYNIADQFFIGRSIGELGNAATNVAFPLSISCTSIALLFGIGGAAAFNLTLGAGNKEKAVYYVGNASVMLFGIGTILSIIVQLFLTPLMSFFGSPENVLDYARTYTSITSIGFPFLILTIGGGHLIRADGSPKYTMFCNLSGAIINVILDPIFIFSFNMGMAGAALATIIGQIFSACLAIWYLCHYKTVKIEKKHLIPRVEYTFRIMSLGAASFLNQVAMMLVQIAMNKSLAYYGALSPYGQSIPLACAGIITKVNQLFFSVVIGLAQGLQPIASFNYGAKQYDRVKMAYSLAIRCGLIISSVAFFLFQLVPRQIMALFGSGSELYFQFAVKYFRIYLLFTFINCIQPISSTFFTAIGKPKKGIFLSLTRQILFLLPLIIIFPIFMGINGIIYAGPIADFIAATVAIMMIFVELRKMEKEYESHKGVYKLAKMNDQED
ncbi:MAG TPA: MATE family efflux transporter [Clostridiaceae bacterium]|nr:MATE family efflux transporter [Clostridiaceae bacterium]